MPKNIEGVEIFATGKHRGSDVVTITDDDLTAMVNSFNELHSVGGFQPVLKLGHDDVQKFFGARKGAPNLGFVEKIWKEGSKILANFSNVPDALFDLIKQRRFNSVSIEMFPKTEFNGTQFRNVLTAVALLGAELPAVKGLKDLAATLFTEEPDDPFQGEKIELKEQDMPATYSQEQVDALVDAAVAKATDTVKAEYSDQVATITTERDEAVAAKKTAEDALRLFEDDTRKANATAMVDKAIEDGRLLPKSKDAALAFALNLSGTVKFGDKETSVTKLFEDFISGLPTKVELGEKGEGSEEKKSFSNASEELHALTLAKQKAEKDMDYPTARQVVLSENEDLKARYFEVED
jgi:hypothetical protein